MLGAGLDALLVVAVLAAVVESVVVLLTDCPRVGPVQLEDGLHVRDDCGQLCRQIILRLDVLHKLRIVTSAKSANGGKSCAGASSSNAWATGARRRRALQSQIVWMSVSETTFAKSCFPGLNRPITWSFPANNRQAWRCQDFVKLMSLAATQRLLMPTSGRLP